VIYVKQTRRLTNSIRKNPYIQGVSEIGGGHILITCFMDRNKEETWHKRVPWCTLCSRYDHFKYQNMRKAASRVAL
jgi:hypothetical protein